MGLTMRGLTMRGYHLDLGTKSRWSLWSKVMGTSDHLKVLEGWRVRPP
jgi:hypothetical protein